MTPRPTAPTDPAAALLERLSTQTARRIEAHRVLEQRFLDLKGELNSELHKFSLRFNAFEREQRELLRSVLDVLAAAETHRGSDGPARDEERSTG